MFELRDVVPWGRSFEEYCRMFALTDTDLSSRILGCGDGPASFNAEATRRGARVVSCDPLYYWNADSIRARIAATTALILEQTRQNAGAFVWDAIASVEELGTRRSAAMRTFLADYAAGQREGRYIAAALPRLPFMDQSFDLALCSHLLFLYTTQLGEAFHLEAVAELCRAASEVRIFPLLALEGARSPLVSITREALTRDGHEVSIEVVPYEFQRGGYEMMRVRVAGLQRPAPAE